jgi:predicted alpha/beta hydrolase family esterase
MKRIFIVHGWGGKPDKGWLDWLNKELKKLNFNVSAQRMPNPDFPEIKPWVSHLKKIVGTPDKDTYFVGHSIGCQTIIRYLETLPDDLRIGGAVFVAGWFNLRGFETEEEKEVATPWIATSIDFNKVRKVMNKSVALFSDDDPYVPLEDSQIFQKKLNSKIIIEKNKGHYIEDVTKEIPVVLKEIINLSK